MIFRHNWYLSIVFLTVALITAIAPPLYIAIAMLFFLGSILLATTNKQGRNNLSWQIKGGIKNTLILASLITICLVIPQVETNMANFSSPIDSLDRTRLV